MVINNSCKHQQHPTMALRATRSIIFSHCFVSRAHYSGMPPQNATVQMPMTEQFFDFEQVLDRYSPKSLKFPGIANVFNTRHLLHNAMNLAGITEFIVIPEIHDRLRTIHNRSLSIKDTSMA